MAISNRSSAPHLFPDLHGPGWRYLRLGLAIVGFCCSPLRICGQDLNTALDNTALTFTTTGTWSLSATNAKDGVDCLLSPPGSAIDPVELRTTVTGPGWLVFWIKPLFGVTFLSVNGESLRSYSSTTSGSGWSRQVIQVTSTVPQQFVWRPSHTSTVALDTMIWTTDLSAPLASALPQGTWTTGGASPWFGLIAGDTDPPGRAMATLPYSAAETTAWLDGTFTGPGRLAWGSSAVSDIFVDGIRQNLSLNYWGSGNGFLPPGEHTVRWQVRRPAGAGWSSDLWTGYLEDVAFTTAAARPLEEVLDTPSLTWTTGGDAPWDGVVMTDPVQVHSAFSGFIHPDQQSWLETIVNGPGVVQTFGFSPDWQMAVRLDLDGATLSQSINSQAVRVGPGAHPVRLSVNRTSSMHASSTFVRARLDRVSWTQHTEVPLEEALDISGLTFSVSASRDVFGLANAGGGTDDAVFLRSGGSLSTLVTGPAVLTWRTSAGGLVCTLDGLAVTVPYTVSQDQAHGPLEIPAGIHEVKWTATTGTWETWIYSITHTPGSLLPLEEALGSAGLTWHVSPEVSSFSLDGTGMACLLVPQNGGVSRLYGLETTVTGPGILTLRSKVRTVTQAWILLDGIPFVLGAGGVDEWKATEMSVPAGTHTITIAAPSPAGGGTWAAPVFLFLDEAAWLPQQSVPLAEGLDATGLTLTNGGTAGWEGVGDGSGDYARAANLLPSQAAWLETTVTGPGLLGFQFRAGSGSTVTQFVRNNVVVPVSFAYPNWIELPEGTHTLRWSFHQPALSGGAIPVAGLRATLDALTWVPYHPQPVEAWSEGQGFSLVPGTSNWQTVAGPDINGGGSLHTGIPSWLDATVTGPAAFSFSVFSIGLQYPNYLTLTLDGARTLKLSNPPGGSGWTEHTVLIPAGIHAIRWTTPPLDQPLVWLDNFRLTPASTEIGAALEMPEAAWTGVGPRQWFTISGEEWQGGSAVTAEHGFEWDYVWNTPPPGLEAVLSGPGRLSIPIRSTIRPSITINGHRDWPVTWTDEPGGWSTFHFTALPGTNTVLISPERFWPEQDQPLHMDHATWEPLAAPSFADLFPLPGAVWSTGPENSFRPVADSPLVAQPSAVCNLLPGAPGGWLEVSLTGPGTLGFSTLALLWGAQCQVLVDGQPMSAVSGTDMQASTSTQLGLFPARENRYQLSLPHGPHTVRWSIPGVSQWRSPVLATLHSFTFTALSGFSGVVTEGSLPFLHGDAAPPQFLSEGGMPFVRILPRSTDEPYWQTLLSSRLTGPGLLRFRWRTAPDMLPQNGTPYLNLWIPGINPDDVIFGNIPGEAAAVGSHSLGLTATWREMQLFIPVGVTHLQWQLPRTGSLDLAGISFTAGSPLPVATALGQPGAQLSTDPLGPWTGWQLPDGTRLVTPPPVNMNTGYILQLEMTVTGPVIMEWDDWARPDGEYGTTWLDGEECFGWPLSPWTPPPPWPSTSPPVRAGLAIPEGQHQFRWILPRLPFGQRNGIGEVTFRPVPAAYAVWLPPFPGYAPGEGPPGAPHPLVDSDSDGLSNLEEFTWRSDPYDFSLPPQPLTAIEAGHLTLCLPAHRPITDGVRVYFETSSDLTTWQRAAAELLPVPPPGQVKYRLTAPLSAASRLYVRTSVEFVE